MTITKRQAEIVSISMKPRPIAEVVPILEAEVRKGGDLFLLPETCIGYGTDIVPERMDGEAVKAIAEIAKRAGVYTCFPFFREGGPTGRLNSAVLFGRSGEVMGIYDKIYPFWDEFTFAKPVFPGKDICVVDTDFGRVGMAICFDANFPSTFKRMSDAGAELVLWASAYSGGVSLQAHAINHNYIIVTSTMVPDCTVYDVTGREVLYRRGEESDILVNRYIADLDHTVFHQDYNVEKRDRLLAEHGDAIELDTSTRRENWFALRSKKAGVSVQALAAQYGIETLRAYKQRSEREIDEMRQTGQIKKR